MASKSSFAIRLRDTRSSRLCGRWHAQSAGVVTARVMSLNEGRRPTPILRLTSLLYGWKLSGLLSHRGHAGRIGPAADFDLQFMPNYIPEKREGRLWYTIMNLVNFTVICFVGRPNAMGYRNNEKGFQWEH